jgi:hypothetical protein
MVRSCKQRPTTAIATISSTDLPNVDSNLPNVDIDLPNVDSSLSNVDNGIDPPKCTDCDKTFATKYTLSKHGSKCKKTKRPFECQVCHNVLGSFSAKSRHLQVCKTKNQEVDTLIGASGSHNNISTVNGDHNTNTQINNNITIVVFKPESSDPTSFVMDHIDPKEFGRQITDTNDRDAVLAYTKALLENPSNRCVKKTNMRSSHSSVHIGENKWETRSDRVVYPSLVTQVANCFTDFLNGKRTELMMQRGALRRLQEFADYMADNGFCADEDSQDEVKKGHTLLVQETKGLIFDSSKSKELSANND